MVILRVYITVSLGLLVQVTLGQSIQSEYYVDSTIKATGTRDARGKSGKWTYYYPGGARSAVEHYRQGELHGEVRYYNLAGTLVERENWHRGLPEDSSFYYHANGRLEKEGIFRQGLYEGVWSFHYDSGQLRRTARLITCAATP